MTDTAPSRATVLVVAAAFIITVVIAWWMLMLASEEDTIVVSPGTRVCVAMLTEDGTRIPDSYYCGPVVLTPHDDIP